jgi:hypothetical protein
MIPTLLRGAVLAAAGSNQLQVIPAFDRADDWRYSGCEHETRLRGFLSTLGSLIESIVASGISHVNPDGCRA